ncbi:MAG: DUF3866 family protein [Coriobacteriia bacterium]|nr:DUF3866 family protein [Coriobacteriia bacterium]
MRIIRGIVTDVSEERAGIQRLLVDVCASDYLSSSSAHAGAGPACQDAPCVAGECVAQGGGAWCPGRSSAVRAALCARYEDCLSTGTPGADDRPVGQLLRRAINYPQLTGRAVPGDRVALNVTAVDLSLGTGGWDVVTCVTPADGRDLQPEGQAPGHIMKLRYAPCQVNVRAVEEQGSPLHDALRDADDCRGLPVACCELHSQAMAVAAAAHATDPSLRIAYVMTDEATLLLPLSDICRSARQAGVLATTLTCGQAAGGEHEAVSLHSALLAVAALGCDAAVVSMGPGIVGTGTAFGHDGVSQGEAVNACAAVNARPIAALRVSFADSRERHFGLSHHAATALGRVALAPALVPVPDPLVAEPLVSDGRALLEPTDAAALLDRQLLEAGIAARHERIDVPLNPGAEASGALTCGLRVTTMGRTPAQDPAFFRCACAAGLVLAREAAARRSQVPYVSGSGCPAPCREGGDTVHA